MDSKTIETLSVNAVKNSIILSDFLAPYIAEGDKEPSWDGFVYIYNYKGRKKSDLKGRVAVQVKGKAKSDLSAERITYSISCVDMHNYLYDGGCIYFVVYVKPNGDNKIYYSALTPVKLKKYLDETKGKSKSVLLTEFPSDNDKKATIFLNFYIDSKKQVSFVTTGLYSLEEYEKNKDLLGLSFSVSGYGYSRGDGIKALLENEIYLYADIKGCTIPQPVDIVPGDLHISSTVQCSITANGKTYYHSYQRVHTLDSTTIKIGDSFSLVFYKMAAPVKFAFKSSSLLRKRAKDTEFMIDALKGKGFRIGDAIFPLNSTEEARIFIEKQRKSLDYYKKMILVLDTLNVDRDIDVDLGKLTIEEKRDFNTLVIAFADKKPVHNLRSDIPAVCTIGIQGVKLLLVFEKCEGTETTYRVYDFFRSTIEVYYKGEDRQSLATSQYSILDKDYYMSVSNIDYDAILPSYQSKLTENPRLFEMANNDMLVMLAAYDEDGQKNKKLLQVAKDFSQWIYNEDTEILSHEIKLLNCLQIIRRERDLIIEETKQLLIIAEDSTMSEDVRTGAYLLLGNQVAAELHFERMEHEVQEAFKRYPIYRFWNSN